MCVRYNLISPSDTARAHFGLGAIETFPPRYNIAPGQPVIVVGNGLSGEREARLVLWGLIPSWLKDPSTRQPFVNARAETAHERAAFRGGIRHRRCLVPANGFYAWRTQGGKRVPFLLRATDGGLLALAGIADHWLGADGSELDTMAILTVPASRDVTPFQERMPLTMPRECFERWLDCRSGETAGIADLLVRADADGLVAQEVNARLNDATKEGADLLVADQPRLL